MRQREKARIWRRFMKGWSVNRLQPGYGRYAFKEAEEIEAVLREGLAGKFDKGAR